MPFEYLYSYRVRDRDLVTGNLVCSHQCRARIVFGHRARALSVKAVLRSHYTAFLPISQSRFKRLSAYLINHCLAVLCKFLGDFWAFWEREIFFLNGLIKLWKT